MIEIEKIKQFIEAILLTSGKPMSEKQLLNLLEEHERPPLAEFRKAVSELQKDCETRGVELIKVGSGLQMQVKPEFGVWVGKLWEEKPPRYSRALMETLALIAYRQPITRGEIEEIRGVCISPSIFKTLQEDRGWIRVVGHKDVPGRPGLYATTKQFLDYFCLESLDKLPPLAQIMEELSKSNNLELDFSNEESDNSDEESSDSAINDGQYELDESLDANENESEFFENEIEAEFSEDMDEDSNIVNFADISKNIDNIEQKIDSLDLNQDLIDTETDSLDPNQDLNEDHDINKNNENEYLDDNNKVENDLDMSLHVNEIQNTDEDSKDNKASDNLLQNIVNKHAKKRKRASKKSKEKA